MGNASRCICIPRRNSPARNCWRRARLAIVDFARVFRNRERGALHHPEFTMLEWYRANETYEALMDDCAAILAETARAAGTKEFRFADRTIDPFAAPERLTVADAFARYAGIDLLATVRQGQGRSRRRLLQRRSRPASPLRKTIPGATSSAAFWPSASIRISAIGRATILYEYPLPQAALARPKPGSDKVAERFELYVCGVELANAFGELTDVAEQRARFEAAMDRKATHPRRALSGRRGFSRRLGADAAGQSESRSVSTGW